MANNTDKTDPHSDSPHPLHPLLAPFSSLLGTWQGQGHGQYPTIQPFDYEQVISISHTGKPFLTYQHTTRNAKTQKPMHFESGVWRILVNEAPEPRTTTQPVELVLSQATGLQEISEGTIELNVDNNTCTVSAESVSLNRSRFAKHPQVTSIKRHYVFNTVTETLNYDIEIATSTQPKRQNHLTSTLHKQQT